MRTIATAILALLTAVASIAQEARTTPPATLNPSYRIMIRDQVQIAVFDEADLSTAQRIDGKGQIRIPLLGNVKLSGLTIRDAEELLERRFIEGEFLKDPMVTVKLLEYATREVSVLGAVRSPGVIAFPLEVNSMDIVDVISKTGGLAGIARGDAVRVTRLDADGQETISIVNVESLITGKGRRSDSERFMVYPGDVIYVPDRLF